MPLNPAASSFADRPSTTKLFDRFRWLPTERLTPGTAEVSGKSCVLAIFAGATPGTSSATSRKLRPFIGKAATSASETVDAIWLRAASSTVESAVTVTVDAKPPTVRTIGSSYAAPAVSVSWRVTSRKPDKLATMS